MKKITLTTVRINNDYYFKIPDLVKDTYKIRDNDDVEVTLHSKTNNKQIEMWDLHPEDLNAVAFSVSEEVHTLNMYNRIYIPQKYRFFFPLHREEFLLITDCGNIKTSLSDNGYITKGLRFWFSLYGPLMPNDKIEIILLDDETMQYELKYTKYKNR
jgi:bifunctional DNA-binding transcriptional regulator/antitoxin component of YhaV-PrlF toxin-antitoxin module